MPVQKTLSSNRTRLRRIFGVVLLVAVVWGCAEVPITGRQGLHLVPESELLTLSLKQYNDVLQKSKLSTDNQKVARAYLDSYRSGFLRGASIGFDIDWDAIKFGSDMKEEERAEYGITERGLVFTKWSLGELSAAGLDQVMVLPNFDSRYEALEQVAGLVRAVG